MGQSDDVRMGTAMTKKEIDSRSCTCHPDDKPPLPCAMRYALQECLAFAGMKIIADEHVPLGVIEFHHPDGRVERVHTNFP